MGNSHAVNKRHLYRTVLELVRDMATDLVSDGARVKVCVQQALGQGVFQVGLMRNLARAAKQLCQCQSIHSELHEYVASCCSSKGTIFHTLFWVVHK